MLGILLNLRRAKLIHLASTLPGHTHRTAHGVFLSRSDWDASGLLDDEVGHMLQRMKPRRGEVIYLIIDETHIPKRGKRVRMRRSRGRAVEDYCPANRRR